MTSLSADDYFHFIELPVRWGDMDMLGHVNNAKFFVYAESARIAYFQAAVDADSRFWKDHGFILANIGCDFLAQLHYPAQIRVGTRLTRIGRSSMQLEHRVFSAGKAVASLRASLVWFDYAAQKTAAVPESLRVFIRQREKGRVEEPGL